MRGELSRGDKTIAAIVAGTGDHHDRAFLDQIHRRRSDGLAGAEHQGESRSSRGDGEPVGRSSAQINRLHLETHRDETGNFGMLEAIDDGRLLRCCGTRNEAGLSRLSPLRNTANSAILRCWVV